MHAVGWFGIICFEYIVSQCTNYAWAGSYNEIKINILEVRKQVLLSSLCYLMATIYVAFVHTRNIYIPDAAGPSTIAVLNAVDMSDIPKAYMEFAWTIST